MVFDNKVCRLSRTARYQLGRLDKTAFPVRKQNVRMKYGKLIGATIFECEDGGCANGGECPGCLGRGSAKRHFASRYVIVEECRTIGPVHKCFAASATRSATQHVVQESLCTRIS